jgi:hypothetical protein
MKSLFLLSVFLILFMNAEAQFFTLAAPDRTYAGLFAGYEKSNSYDGSFIEVGGSYKGIYELRLFRNSDTFDGPKTGLDNDDAGMDGLGFKAAWWPVRKELQVMDINAGVWVGMARFKYMNYTWGAPQQEYEGFTTFSAGAISNLNIHFDQRWTLHPYFALEFNRGSESFGPKGNPSKEDISGAARYTGVAISREMKNEAIVYLLIEESSSSYSQFGNFMAGFGVIFPLD